MRRLSLAFKNFGIILSSDQLELFEQYLVLLHEWKSKVNLTSITEREKVINLHFLDSLSVIVGLESEDLNKKTALDVGTGAGFPGIPLKIAFPQMQLNLLESNQKKVSFLRVLVDKLGLSDVYFYHGRAENFAHDFSLREQFDYVFARSLARLSVLSELTLPFLSSKGKAIMHKREPIENELEDAQLPITILGGSKPQIVPVKHPNLPDTSILVIISKITSTPLNFPRRVGVPNKRPLKG